MAQVLVNLIVDVCMISSAIFIIWLLRRCFYCASPLVCKRMKHIYSKFGFRYKTDICTNNEFIDFVCSLYDYKTYFLVHTGTKEIHESITYSICVAVMSNEKTRSDYPKLRMLGGKDVKSLVNIKKVNDFSSLVIFDNFKKITDAEFINNCTKATLNNGKIAYINGEKDNISKTIELLNKIVDLNGYVLNAIQIIEFNNDGINLFVNADYIKAYRWDDDFSKEEKIQETTKRISNLTNVVDYFI